MYMMVSVSQLTGRSHLRSAQNGEFDTPHIRTTFEPRSFSVAALQALNHLPADIQMPLHHLHLQETPQDLSFYDCILLLD